MRLELKDIKDGGLEQGFSWPVERFPGLRDLEEQEDLAFKGPLKFQLRLQKAGQLVELDGHLQGCVSLACGRCLQAFDYPLDADFALTFSPQPTAIDEEEVEAEVELDADELGLIYYRDEALELLQPLEEQVIMALPISPICRQECRGLCPECGCNLNEQTCTCEKKLFNSKFSALAKLKLDLDK